MNDTAALLEQKLKIDVYTALIDDLHTLNKRHGIVTLAEALCTVAWSRAGEAKERLLLNQGDDDSRCEALSEYDLYVVAYQRLKSATVDIAEFLKVGTPLTGNYWPRRMKSSKE